jgi:hypothetical protein
MSMSPAMMIAMRRTPIVPVTTTSGEPTNGTHSAVRMSVVRPSSPRVAKSLSRSARTLRRKKSDKVGAFTRVRQCHHVREQRSFKVAFTSVKLLSIIDQV